MKNTVKKILACLLAGMMFMSTVACTGGETPTDTTPGDTVGTSDATDAPGNGAHPGTEDVTLPPADGYEVEEGYGGASVKTPLGLSYTVWGFTEMNQGTATFTNEHELVYQFPEGTFADRFNRFTMVYSSTQPVKVWVHYTERGAETVDYFFVDAGEGTFSGLSAGFIKGYTAKSLVEIRVESLSGKPADFTLAGLTTQRLDKPASTVYVENERFKLGVELCWGGAVSYLEDKACSIPDLGNLVNKHDTGRLIQQSFYGVQENDEYKPGISFDTKWRYNPVQGGDQYNNASRLIDFTVTENSIYIKAQPQDWSLDNQLTPSYMENTYTLESEYVKVDNRFTDYSGWEHPFAGQELPAFYTVSYLDTFVWYNGEDSWSGDALSSRNDLPFWGDHAGECTFILREKNTETWCAWINGADDYGLGVYAPNIDQLKAGRYLYDGSKSDMAESTGYVAPINVLKMVSFKPIEYSYLLAAGSTAEIRKIFTEKKDFTENKSLHENYQSTRLPSVEGDITRLDFTAGQNLALLTNPVDTTVVFDETMGAVKLTAGSYGDVNVTIPYGSNPKPLSAESYKTLKIEYMIPTDASMPAYQSDIFLCAGALTAPDGNARIRVNLTKDGEFHVLEVDLSNNAYWNGNINLIRFDYFDFSSEGDVMYVKSITLE